MYLTSSDIDPDKLSFSTVCEAGVYLRILINSGSTGYLDPAPLVWIELELVIRSGYNLK